MRHEHPNFGYIRTEFTTGAFSASAAGTAYVGSTLKVYTKAAVLGCLFELGSGASLSATGTVGIGRILDGGALSVHQKQTISIGLSAAAIGTVYDVSLSTPMTISSFKDSAVIQAAEASLADKGCVLQTIIWRYRLLPKAGEPNETM